MINELAFFTQPNCPCVCLKRSIASCYAAIRPCWTLYTLSCVLPPHACPAGCQRLVSASAAAFAKHSSGNMTVHGTGWSTQLRRGAAQARSLDVTPRSIYVVYICCIYQPYLACASRFVLMALPRRSRASSSCTPVTGHHSHPRSRAFSPECSGRYERQAQMQQGTLDI